MNVVERAPNTATLLHDGERAVAGRDVLPPLAVGVARAAHADRPEGVAVFEASLAPPAPDRAAGRSTVVYYDPRALTRDCIGGWLQQALEGYEVRLVDDLAADSGGARPGAILVNGRSLAVDAVSRLMAEVGRQWHDVPVVWLSDDENAESILRAFDCGIRGYIPTSLASQVAVEAVRLVCAGGTFVPVTAIRAPGRKEEAKVAPRATGGPSPRGFTQRQIEILDCLRRGLANKLIAYELDMCESTVKVHIRNIMRKLKATNRTQVVYLTRDLFDGAD